MICTKCSYEWLATDSNGLGNCPVCGADTLLMLNSQLENPTVERILQNLLLVKGKDILKDKQRLSAMIDDLFSNDQRTMRLLRLSIQEGIPIKLSELYHLKSADLSAKISAFKAQVKENTFCEDKALTKVFQFWTNALNPPKALSTKYEPEDGLWRDNAGVAYSADRKKLWGGFSGEFYKIIKGTKVICDKAFSNHNPSILESSLRGIVIPTSLNLIGDHAFSCCENLQNITIPNSVTSIGFGAFSGCESLREIRIPDSINEIKEHVFAYSGLMSIEIPNSVNSIGSTAFSHSSLSSIKIPESVISLGSDAFSACISLKNIEVNELNMHYKSVDGVLFDKDLKTIVCCPAGKKFKENVFVLPSSVTTIGRGAFLGCSNIESVEIPNSVTKIEKDAFKECTNLRIVEIPNSVITIEHSAFSGCSNLQSVEIPNSVTTIEGGAFFECSSLQNVKIPNAVASIEECTFAECKNLSTITIPGSVNSIKRYAFRACTNLQSVRIQNSVISIEESAFIYCINLQSVRIPNSVTSIGNSAFSGCANLQSLMLPDSLKSIGNNAFLDCDRLVAIEVNELNMHFASLEGVLYDKNLDTLIYCPSGKIFEGNVFTVPLSVKTIKSHSFYKCQHLQSVNIHNSVISIEEGAFESSSIQSIDLPNSINVIERDTFKSCENLQSITVPNSVTSIGSSAFINCKNIQRIIISDSVTSIGQYAFCGCENLLSIKLPDFISRLGGGTFEGCFNLQNITLPYDLTNFTDYEFLRCHSLRSITIPDYWIRSLLEDENLQSVVVDELPDFLKRIFEVCEKLNQIIINPGLSIERKTIKVIRN